MSEATTSPDVTAESVFTSPLLTKTLAQSKIFAAKSLLTMTNSSKFMWHAALGTAATAEAGLTSFSKTMAAKGSEIEAKAKADIAKKVFKMKEGTVKTKVKLTGLSKEKVDDIEKMISKGMNKSLHAVGVPTRGDLDKLALLMNEMSQSIEDLAVASGSKSKRSSTSKPVSM